MLRADLERGAQSLVGLRRRHADVEDRDVGRARRHLFQEVLGGRALPDDVEAGLAEQPHDALAQENIIVGDDHPHGRSARIVVPSPGRLVTWRRPSSASTRSANPRSPVPRRGSAPPAPSSATSTTSVAAESLSFTVACEAPAYFATFVSASVTK